MLIYGISCKKIINEVIKMRILLKLITENDKLPLDYRRVFISFLKKSLSEIAEGKYYNKYYLNGGRRPFTFAVNLPNPKFSKENIVLNRNEIKLIFSTNDSFTGFVFMSAFLAQKNKKFPMPHNNSMTLVSVSKLSEKTTQSNSVMVKMFSPLCLREHIPAENKDKYYSVKSENFNAECKKIIKTQLILDGFSEKIAESTDIIPIDCKKTVVYHYGNNIECSLGDFVITADKSVINYFLKSGIGSRKSAGFGFAELIAEC